MTVAQRDQLCTSTSRTVTMDAIRKATPGWYNNWGRSSVSATLLREVIPMNRKFLLTGLKKIPCSRTLGDAGALDTSTVQARVLFGPPPETAAGERPTSWTSSLQVTLFEELGRSDPRRLARIVHERSYYSGRRIYL